MTRNINITQAGPQDYEIIKSLAIIVWPHTYSKILSGEQLDYMFDMMYSREAYTAQINDKAHAFLLAQRGGKYIGFASYETNYKPGVTKVHKLYILPNIQRSGAGQALLTAIETRAENSGNIKITLNVNRYNPALGFYLAKGFTNVASEDITIGNGYLMEDYVMEKEI